MRQDFRDPVEHVDVTGPEVWPFTENAYAELLRRYQDRGAALAKLTAVAKVLRAENETLRRRLAEQRRQRVYRIVGDGAESRLEEVTP